MAPRGKGKEEQIAEPRAEEGEASSSAKSKDWAWLESIMDEAHLPDLGKPTEWKDTEGAHTKIVYDPATKTAHDIETHIEKHHKTSPVSFIQSTAGKNPMPGTKQPSSVRFQLFMQPEFQHGLVKDVDGSVLVPCLVHGDFVKVESLQADHLQAKEKILARQQNLIMLLNTNKDIEDTVMELEGINKFFVKVQMGHDKEPKIYGTLFFYELYFNDIDNLWLICQACNLHKSNQDTFTWFKKQWLYGKNFLTYLMKEGIKDEGILIKIGDKQGLAEVAIKWFWSRHATYISNAREFFAAIIKPIKILNYEIDAALMSEEEQIASELQESYLLRKNLMQEIADMQGIDMPGAAEVLGKKPIIITDAEGKQVPFTQPQFAAARGVTEKEAPPLVNELLTAALKEQIAKDSTANEDDVPPKKRRRI
jgi:hypothetical protein